MKEWTCWLDCSGCNLKKLYGKVKKNLLDTEHALLQRIFTRFFPGILKELFKNPMIAWRKVLITFISLFFITLSYYPYLLLRPFRGREPGLMNLNSLVQKACCHILYCLEQFGKSINSESIQFEKRVKEPSHAVLLPQEKLNLIVEGEAC